MKVQEVLENYNVYKVRISITEAEIEEIKNDIIDIKSSMRVVANENFIKGHNNRKIKWTFLYA